MRLPHGIMAYSKRLILSYCLDWLAIILIAAIGGAISFVKPFHRPFSLLDLSISYPITPETVTTTILVLVCLVAPALIIAIVVFLFVPGPAFRRTSNRSQVWRLKLWEWEKGWAGLGLSIAIAVLVTQGTKNLFGKPRPDLLARCVPDIANIASHVVGGFGQDISARWTLVDSGICTTDNISALNDGFRSFPSGHSSFSWSAMLYLSLFLCSKFMIAIPFLPATSEPQITGLNGSENHELLPLHNNRGSTEETVDKRPDSGQPTMNTPSEIPIRNRAAAPPVHLLILAFIPVAVAVWIVSTRYVEFYHHGFDVISGSLIGVLSAWFSFRWYHLPLRQGQGWAWGARSRDRAFGIGVGTRGYVGDEGWQSAGKRRDVESG